MDEKTQHSGAIGGDSGSVESSLQQPSTGSSASSSTSPSASSSAPNTAATATTTAAATTSQNEGPGSISASQNQSSGSSTHGTEESRSNSGGASHPAVKAEKDEFLVGIFEPKHLKEVGIVIHDFAYSRDDARFDCVHPELPDDGANDSDIIKVRALFDYDGEGENELSFKENDIILITDSVGNGWLSGILGGKIGFVPEGYVERFD